MRDSTLFAPSEAIEAEAARLDQLPPFQSDAQMVEAMKDPRYRSDAVYRREVYQRIYARNS